MRPADIAIFEHVAGDLLAKLGYERTSRKSSFITAVRVGLAQLGWQSRRMTAQLARLRRKRRDSASR
jgi:hypothetical protein